jgi:hypothetical protein
MAFIFEEPFLGGTIAEEKDERRLKLRINFFEITPKVFAVIREVLQRAMMTGAYPLIKALHASWPRLFSVAPVDDVKLPEKFIGDHVNSGMISMAPVGQASTQAMSSTHK